VFTVLRDAHDPQVKAEFQQFLTQRGRYDSVVVRSEGRLNGLDGTFGDGTAAGDGIDFTVKDGGQKVVPKLAKVVGFVFEQRPDPAAPPVLCKVSDAARNLLVAADVTLNDRGLAVTTVAGARVTYPDAGRLTRLDFSKGKLTYLSDLEPTAVVETSTEDHVFHFRRDANLDGGPLRMGGEAYAKGLGVHSRTVLTYDIGGEYREFRAVLGVDEGVLTDARVQVVIEGDGRELYKAEVGRKDPPRPVALDVKGVRQLRVIVQSAGLLDLGAQVNLGEARVSK
jgi:hypothetical protein